jgi:hypothetical protein
MASVSRVVRGEGPGGPQNTLPQALLLRLIRIEDNLVVKLKIALVSGLDNRPAVPRRRDECR